MPSAKHHARLWKKEPGWPKNSPEEAVMVNNRAVRWRAGQHDAVPATEGKNRPGHDEQGNGPGDRDVAATGDERNRRVSRLELGSKLNDRQAGCLPVGGVEDETLAFLRLKPLSLLALSRRIQCPGLRPKLTGDLLN